MDGYIIMVEIYFESIELVCDNLRSFQHLDNDQHRERQNYKIKGKMSIFKVNMKNFQHFPKVTRNLLNVDLQLKSIRLHYYKNKKKLS